MTGQVRVLNALATTIQDEGRPHLAHVGVPASGAWDTEAHLALRGLIAPTGLSPSEQFPVLENLAGNLEVSFSGPTWFAYLGPGQATVDGHALPPGTAHRVAPSAWLAIQRTGPGPIYLAIAGLRAERMLGSASTDTHSGLGPAPVRPGDCLAYDSFPDGTAAAFIRRAARTGSPRVWQFLPHPGPLARWVTQNSWTVSAVSRAGVHLMRVPEDCQDPAPTVPLSLPSYPTVEGLLQMPSADRIIALGPDCGTAGGYATAGTLTASSLPDVASVVNGQLITLREQGAPVALTYPRRWNLHRDVTCIADANLA